MRKQYPVPAEPVTLSLLSRLQRQLRQDQELPLKSLQARDHAIGQSTRGLSRQAQLQHWLDAVDQEHEQGSTAHHFEVPLRFWLFVLGFGTGIATMSGLLLVEGQRPVNVLMLLTVFVGLQLLLLIFTLVSATQSAIGASWHLPFESFNPVRLFFRRTWRTYSKGLPWQTVANVARWELLREGQLFGIAFNIGGILSFLVILAVVDRSFGWSSTFDISDEGLYQVLHVVAMPWTQWLPDANISRELISVTRFQSLQLEYTPTQLANMGKWWPFVLACVIVYGLVPRLLLWLLFGGLYRRQLIQSFLHFPGVELVLDRMNAPTVSTRIKSDEYPHPSYSETTFANTDKPELNSIVVSWAGTLSEKQQHLLGDFGLNNQHWHNAGIDLVQDQSLLQEINKNNQSVVIAVKSWEPPLAELSDFIQGILPTNHCYLLLLSLPTRQINSDEKWDWQHFANEQERQVGILLADYVGEPSQ